MEYFFLALQGSYKNLSLALCKNGTVVATRSEPGCKTSARLLPLIEDILSQNSLSLSDVSFFTLDHGPGAFTSLRALIVTLNGISYASGIPLVGVDGLDALCAQTLSVSSNATLMVCLLNAFNKEVFYAISTIDAGKLQLAEEKSYCKIDVLIAKLQDAYPQHQIVLSGNGAQLYRDEITQALGQRAHFPDDAPLVASATQIAQLGYEQWQSKQNITNKVSPQYLKTQSFVKKFE